MAANVQVLAINTRKSWDTSVQELCRDAGSITGHCLISLPADIVLDESLTSQLSDAFGIPPYTWWQQYQKATGYFHVDEVKQADGQISSYNTCFRFLIKNILAKDYAYPGSKSMSAYEWTEIGFWTQWKPSQSSILLCMIQGKEKLSIWNDICTLLQDNQTMSVQAGPFDWHQLVLPIISQAFDQSVWICRDRIRQMEQHRPTISSVRPQYTEMHETARHNVHISETLDMSINVLTSISQEIHTFGQTQVCREQALAFDQRASLRLLSCQKTLLQCALGRSQALASRLQNEINLAFHIGAERDSAIAVQMARAMQQDSAAMTTISVLGLVFLPGTFVSALFGMSFFTFVPDSAVRAGMWTVSPAFWVYWVITVPMTLVTVIVWHIWQRRNLGRSATSF